MPIQEFPLIHYNGGLNNCSNPRDIADNELAQADDVVFDSLGRIKMMGGLTALGLTITSPIDTTAGYGLYRFDSDYALSGKTSKNFIALAGRTAGSVYELYIYDIDANGYASNPIVVNSTGGSDFRPVFYYIDGMLRICDASFDTDSVNKYFGYIKRTHFDGLTPGASADEYDGYYSGTNALTPPTVGLFDSTLGQLSGTGDTGSNATTIVGAGNWAASLIDGKGYIAVNSTEGKSVEVLSHTSNIFTTDSGVTDWLGDSFRVYPPAGLGFNIEVEQSSLAGNGTWPAGTYGFASTFIYDDNQESLLYEMGGTYLPITLEYGIDATIYTTSPFNPRISGGRIYTKRDDDTDWYMLYDISLEKGVRTKFTDEYTAWSQEPGYGGADDYYIVGTASTSWSPSETYTTINGYDPGKTDTTSIKYKTAVTANRMAYVGNVEYNGVLYEDAIFKSYPNKFDTFTLERRIEIVRGDGESIIRLEEFADRLLVFKESTLYILNISQEIEFLENVFDFKGVTNPYQVFRSEYGIIWANEQGCYLYDGQTITDLLLDRENPSRRKIDLDIWQAFIISPLIGYDPIKKNIIIIGEITSQAGSQDIYLYNLVNGAWSIGKEKISAAANYTNFEVDESGNLIIYQESGDDLYKWDNTYAASSNMDIRFKEVPFGSLVRDKRFYGVNITHKNSGTNTTTATYGINSETPDDSFSSGVLTNNSTFGTQKFRLSTITDCKSAQIRVYSTGTTPANFEIGDISLLFRPKGVR